MSGALRLRLSLCQSGSGCESQAESLTDDEIEARMFPKPVETSGPQRPLPDCQHIYDELRAQRKKVSLTLMQLWFE